MDWSRGRGVLKLALALVGETTGATQVLTAAERLLHQGGPSVRVLGFHRVVDDLAELPPEVIHSICITTTALEGLLVLARERFEVLTLRDAAEVLAGRRRARRDVIVFTFDDGYRDVYLRALPLLRRHEIPATVFVPTGLIGSRDLLPHDRLHALLVRAAARGLRLDAPPTPRQLARDLERTARWMQVMGPAGTVERLIAELPAQALSRIAEAIEGTLGESVSADDGGRVMDAKELRACADAGVELGAHTVGHVALVHEPTGRARRELEEPRRELEAISGRPCNSFAYCNGLWSPALRHAVREAGYRVAVTTTEGSNRPGDDPLLLGRKMLWEGHVRAVGRYSSALACAHLHDLFGLHAQLLRALRGRRDLPPRPTHDAPPEERRWA